MINKVGLQFYFNTTHTKLWWQKTKLLLLASQLFLATAFTIMCNNARKIVFYRLHYFTVFFKYLQLEQFWPVVFLFTILSMFCITYHFKSMSNYEKLYIRAIVNQLEWLFKKLLVQVRASKWFILKIQFWENYATWFSIYILVQSPALKWPVLLPCRLL